MQEAVAAVTATNFPMTPLEALKTRYATKAFDPSRKISKEDWKEIEQTLVLTPSSFGLQPWKFHVITDQALKDELTEQSWNQTQISQCSHLVVLTARTEVTEEIVDEWLATLSEVQGKSLEDLGAYRGVLLQFTQNMSDDEVRAWSQRQTYIALGQLMLTAPLMGIDACPLEGIVPAEYDRVLGLKDSGYFTSVACALGYRAKDDKYADVPKARFSAEKVIVHS